MHLRKLAVTLIAALALVTFAASAAPIDYPKTKKIDQVDDYHGTKVADPYRWLETDVRTSKEVADWVTAENKITFDYLGAIPSREPIRKQRRPMRPDEVSGHALFDELYVAADGGGDDRQARRHRFESHSTFCTCSRNCSICALSSSPCAVSLTSFALAQSVLASRDSS